MTTSKTSTVSFDDKCAILAEFWLEESEKPQFQAMAQHLSIIFRMALLINFDFVKPTKKGTKEIEDLWDFLINELIGEQTAGPIESLEDIRYWAKDGLFTEPTE